MQNPKIQIQIQVKETKDDAGKIILLVGMAYSVCQQWQEDLPVPNAGNTGSEMKEPWEVRESTDCMFQHAVLTRSMPNFSNKLEVWVLCPIARMKLHQIEIMPSSSTVKWTLTPVY